MHKPLLSTRGILRATAILTVVAAGFQTTAGHAQRASYSTQWMVANALDTPGGAPRTIKVKSGDVFLRHRLLPKAAAILEDDLKDEGGKIILAKGAEMFALQSDGAVIFCDANQQSPGAMKSLLVASGFKNVCGVDSNRDGRFESYFNARSLVKGLPSIEGRLPKTAKQSSAAAYRLIAPETMTTRYFVAVEYEGKPLLYDRRNFRITFGEGDRRKSLSDWSYLKGGDYPKSLNLLGSSFSLLSEKDGLLEIRIDREIPEQPFGVRVSITYG